MKLIDGCYVGLAGLLVASMSSSLSAEVLVNTATLTPTSKISIGAAIVTSETEYDLEDTKEISGGIIDVERRILSAEIGIPVQQDLDLVFFVGRTIDGDYEDPSIKGEDVEGSVFGVGARTAIHRKDNLTVMGYGVLTLLNEDIEDIETEGADKAKIDTELTEIQGGVTASLQINPKFALYSGIELIPYSEGDAKGEEFETDLSREEIINLRIGTNYTVNDMVLRGELALLGERSLTIASSYNF